LRLPWGRSRKAPVEGIGHADATVVHRLMFFSDAVFAIVPTLLALELRAPEAASEDQLPAALLAMAPSLVAFAGSFALVSVFWAAHLAMLRRLIVFDWRIAWLNLAFLFTICLMPFASSLIGRFSVFGQAWRIYCGVLVAASLAQAALLLAIFRGGGKLTGGIEPSELRYKLLRALSPALAFGAGLALSLAGAKAIAAQCWVLFVPIMLFGRFVVRAKGSAASR
jgi:uncharacterized membrane protein